MGRLDGNAVLIAGGARGQGAPTPSRSPEKARTSSRVTLSRRSTPCPTTYRPATTSTRPCVRSRTSIALAQEVAASGITVNAVRPTTVDTTMIQNDAAYRLFMPDHENPTREDAARVFQTLDAIPIPWVDVEDISNAMLFLASDDARYITGETIAVAAGQNASNAA